MPILEIRDWGTKNISSLLLFSVYNGKAMVLIQAIWLPTRAHSHSVVLSSLWRFVHSVPHYSRVCQALSCQALPWVMTSTSHKTHERICTQELQARVETHACPRSHLFLVSRCLELPDTLRISIERVKPHPTCRSGIFPITQSSSAGGQDHVSPSHFLL